MARLSIKPTYRNLLANLPVIGGFLTSSHLVSAAGRERFIPAVFGRLHSTRKTPLNAALLQAAITIVFIVIGGGFRSLINFAVVASWAFYFLTVGSRSLNHYPLHSRRLHVRSWVSSFYVSKNHYWRGCHVFPLFPYTF